MTKKRTKKSRKAESLNKRKINVGLKKRTGEAVEKVICDYGDVILKLSKK